MVKKRVLITGVAGFIGSNLAMKLLNDKNMYIVGIDNFYTGSEDHVLNLKENKNFEFIRHDVVSPILLEIDEIYHLASPASPVFYQQNPIKTLKTNFIGTMNMLGLAKRVKAKILLTSTSEVYGDPIMHPQREEYWGNVNPIGIRACYDEGKRISETLMFEYHRNHNVRIKVCRIFNTYGIGMSENDGRVVSNFIMQALNGEDITIYGSGNQTRSFCFVDDMVEGIIKLMNTPDNVTGPVNIGSDDELKIIDIANAVIRLTGSKSKIVYKDLPDDDPTKRKPDLSKAHEILSWSSTTSLEEGLMKTIEYFRSLK